MCTGTGDGRFSEAETVCAWKGLTVSVKSLLGGGQWLDLLADGEKERDRRTEEEDHAAESASLAGAWGSKKALSQKPQR